MAKAYAPAAARSRGHPACEAVALSEVDASHLGFGCRLEKSVEALFIVPPLRI
jgi:hypothetical protein